MIIDCHVHIGRWNNPLYQPRGAVTSTSFYESTWPEYKAIYMPSDQRDNDNPELVEAKHRWWWFDPHSMKLPVSKLPENVVGFKVHSGIDRVMNGIISEHYEEMLKYAAATRRPVLVHCGNWKQTSTYEFLTIAANYHPDVQFIAAHCGGGGEPNMFKAITDFSRRGNIMVDTSSVKYPGVIEHAINTLGASRILFGSDWPIMSPEAARATHLAVPGINNVVWDIEAGNAQKLFNIEG